MPETDTVMARFPCAVACAVLGYLWYAWWGDHCLVKPHPRPLEKKHGLMRLLWGFLMVAGFPAILCLTVAAFWRWEWPLANFLALTSVCFTLGGVARYPRTKRRYLETYGHRDPIEPVEDEEGRHAA